MKKIKLFMMAIAAMLGCNVYAQSWTADVVQEGVYLLYNIGSGQYLARGNAWDTQGSISRCDGDALPVQLIAEGSNYLIRTGVNGEAKGLEAHNSTDFYVDQSQGKKSSFTFVRVGSNEYGPIYNIISADNHSAGSGKVMAANPDNTKLVYGDASSNYAKWQLRDAVPALKTFLAMEAASTTNPVDVSGLILNNHFYRYEFSEPKRGRFWTMVANNNNLSGGMYWNRCAESYHSDFTLSQTITVPNGTYQLKAQGFYRQDGSDNDHLPVFYANNETVTFPARTGSEGSMDAASESFTNGNYWSDPVTVTVTNNTLTVGAKLEGNTNLWCIWDNFQLTCLGADLSSYPFKDELLKTINSATATNNGTKTAALTNAISAAQAVYDNASATPTAVVNAINALKDKVEETDALRAKIVSANEIIAFAEQIGSTDSKVVAAKNKIASAATDASVTAEAINTALCFVEPGKYYLRNAGTGTYWTFANDWLTTASLTKHGEYVIFAQLSDGTYSLESRVTNGGTEYYFNGKNMDNGSPDHLTIIPIGGKYVIKGASNGVYGYDGSSTVLGKGIDPATDNAKWTLLTPADMAAEVAAATYLDAVDATYLIADPGFNRNHRDAAAWSKTNVSGSDGNVNVNFCVESYHSDFELSQTLTVPNGVYSVSAQGFYRQDGADEAHLPVFFAADQTSTFPALTGSENSMTEAAEAFYNGKYAAEPIYVKVTDGTLKIGAKLEGNGDLWCIMDNFELTYFGDCTIDQAVKGGAYLALSNTLEQAKAINTASPTKVLTDAIAVAEPLLSFSTALGTLKDAETTLAGVISANSALFPAVASANKIVAYVEEADETVNQLADAIAATKATIYNTTDPAVPVTAAYALYDGSFLDFSDVITNAQPTANQDGWTIVSETYDGNHNKAFRDDLGVAEYWRYNFEFNQELSLPAGTYVLENVSYARSGATNVILYAGNKTVDLVQVSSGVSNNVDQASAYFNADRENGMNRIVFNLPADGKVKIGLKNTNNLGANDGWTIWRSFKLQAVPASIYPAILAQAQALVGTPMEADIAQYLNEEIQTYGAVALTDKDALVEAIGHLRKAIETATRSIDLYKEIAHAIEVVKAQATTAAAGLASIDDAYAAGAYHAVAEAIADYQVIEGKTLINADETAAQLSDPGYADFTSMLVNPSFETGDMTGWTTPKAGADCDAKKSNDPVYEFSKSDGNYVFNNWAGYVTTLDLNQTVKGLPNGNYTLTGVVAGYGDEAPITIKANTEEIVIAPKADNVDAEVHNGYEFTIPVKVTTGELVIYVKNDGKGNTFFKADNFKLLYEPLSDLALNAVGGATFAVKDGQEGIDAKQLDHEGDAITDAERTNNTIEVGNAEIKHGIQVQYAGVDAVNTEIFECGFRAAARITDSKGNVFTVKTRGDKNTNIINVAEGVFGPSEEYEVVIEPITYYNYDKFCDEIYTQWEEGKATHQIDDPADPSGVSKVTDPTWTLEAAARAWTANKFATDPLFTNAPDPVDGWYFDYCDPMPYYCDNTKHVFLIKTDDSVKANVKSLGAQDFKAFDKFGNDWTDEFLTLNGGIATGVNKLDAANGKSVIYNVAGQRVAKAQKGIYVVNGKKVAVK